MNEKISVFGLCDLTHDDPSIPDLLPIPLLFFLGLSWNVPHSYSRPVLDSSRWLSEDVESGVNFNFILAYEKPTEIRTIQTFIRVRKKKVRKSRRWKYLRSRVRTNPQFVR